MGPTGVGKTALALALAAERPIEVVSVDSRQVYRGMDVGTGKPTSAERQGLRHHLVDIVDPDERYDAARFAREATAAIADIRARGRHPVLVGGTGLYYRALLRGLSPRPPADSGLRARLHADGMRLGAGTLYQRLAALDPGASARLHPNDLVRVIRALEVALLTGPAPAAGTESWAPRERLFRTLTVGLTAARPALYAALDARVNRMLAAGLLEEVRGLIARGYGPDLPAMQGIGYRHLAPVVGGQRPLAEAIAAIKRDTRRYAKRQWTWFAREESVHWLRVAPDHVCDSIDEIKKMVDRTRIFD